MGKPVRIIDLTEGKFLGEFQTALEADRRLQDGFQGIKAKNVYVIATIHKCYIPEIVITLKDVSPEILKLEAQAAAQEVQESNLTPGDVDKKVTSLDSSSTPIPDTVPLKEEPIKEEPIKRVDRSAPEPEPEPEPIIVPSKTPVEPKEDTEEINTIPTTSEPEDLTEEIVEPPPSTPVEIDYATSEFDEVASELENVEDDFNQLDKDLKFQ